MSECSKIQSRVTNIIHTQIINIKDRWGERRDKYKDKFLKPRSQIGWALVGVIFSVEGENGEPGEKDKKKRSKEGKSKGGSHMLAECIVGGAHLVPPHVLVAFQPHICNPTCAASC